MYSRFLKATISTLQGISPVILLSGPRQVGKSTLSLQFNDNRLLLDNVTVRAAALEDPVLFIQNLKKPVCIDEIQKVPALLEAIKIDVDLHRRNGDYLLTGSVNVLDMSKVGDTLAGRLIEVTMWPLCYKEISGSLDNVVDILFTTHINKLKIKKISIEKIIHSILTGGYPPAVAITNNESRAYWFSAYISTYVERDIRDVGEIRHLPQFIKLFNLLAARSANLLNIKNLANTAALNEQTVENYLTMLEMIFQIKRLQPYFSNFSKRFIKTPKLFFTDSGILAHLLNVQTQEQWLHSDCKGAILETFVFSELLKHISYSAKNISLYHYRTHDQKEIDFILEYNNRVIAIEVKSTSQITQQAFKHLIDFKNHCDQFHLGIVLYLGDTILPFGEKLFAVPLSLFF